MGLFDPPPAAGTAPKMAWRGATRGTTPSLRGALPASGATRGSRGGRGAAARGGAAGRTTNLSWRAGMEGMGSEGTGSAGGTAEDTPEPLFMGNVAPYAGTPVFIGGGAPASAPPAFVAGLEALSQDSDSRKLRFETTLSHNRYMELKPFRESQRISDIKNGFIPDPLKPMRLDEATNFVGTCEDMCPEFEREEREYQKAVDVLERFAGTTRIDPAKAVKAFHRPAAGNDQPLPSDVRPPHILKSTLDYLFHTIVMDNPLGATHPFMRDRTRAIRQDFTMQNERGPIVIECNERIARYHILALGALREQPGFSESQELEQLRKVLKSLNEFYDDARMDDPPIPTPNEAEFRSYNILTHLRDPDIIWSTELLPLDVFNSPLLQTAITLHALAQRSNTTRGERASLNAFSRFFKLIAKDSVPYLFGCILSTHFPEVRRNAVEVMRGAYIKQHSGFPASTLGKVLGCDDEEEVLAICETWGLEVDVGEGGSMVVLLHKAAAINNAVLPQRVSQRLVESKRGSIPYYEIIDGTSMTIGSVPSVEPSPLLASSPRFRRVSVRSPPISSLPSLANSALPSPALPPKNALALAAKLDYFPPTPSPLNPFAAPTPVTRPTAPIPSLNPFATSFVPPAPSTAFVPAPAPIPFTLPVVPPPPRPIVKLPAARRPSVIVPIIAPLPPPKARQPSLPIIPLLPPKHLTKQLTASLLTSLLTSYTTLPIRRAASLALSERWSSLSQSAKRTRSNAISVLSWNLTESLLRRVSREGSMEAVVRVRGERWRKKVVFGEWVEGTERKIVEGEREAKRRGILRKVEEDIGVGVRVREEEQGLDMGSLGIEVEKVRIEGDWDLATTIAQKQLARETLWRPETFLEHLVSPLAGSLKKLKQETAYAPKRWDAVISTEGESGFKAWLGCKFGLEDGSVRRMVSGVEVDVKLFATPGVEKDVESAGLIIFDCTSSNTELNWKACRERLHAFVASVSRHSPYEPALLVLMCPASTLSEAETAELTTKIETRLDMPALAHIASSSVLVVDLAKSENQMQRALKTVVQRVVLRPERASRPLSHVVRALLDPWTTSLRDCIESTDPSLSPVSLIAIFIDVLNTIIAQTIACASSPTSLRSLPLLPSSQAPLRQQIEEYVQLYPDPGRFLLLHTALSAIPAIQDLALASNLLEHLSILVLDVSSAASTTQEQYDVVLASGIGIVESALEAGMKRAMDRDRDLRKKRKASDGLEITNKKSNREVPIVVLGTVRGRTSLGSLNLLLADVRDLLK